MPSIYQSMTMTQADDDAIGADYAAPFQSIVTQTRIVGRSRDERRAAVQRTDAPTAPNMDDDAVEAPYGAPFNFLRYCGGMGYQATEHELLHVWDPMPVRATPASAPAAETPKPDPFSARRPAPRMTRKAAKAQGLRTWAAGYR